MKRIITLIIMSLCITSVMLLTSIPDIKRQQKAYKKWEGLSLEEAKEAGLTVYIVPELDDDENIYLNKKLKYYDEEGIMAEFKNMWDSFNTYFSEKPDLFLSSYLEPTYEDGRFLELMRYLKKNDPEGYMVLVLCLTETEPKPREFSAMYMSEEYLLKHSPDAGKNYADVQQIQNEYKSESGYGLSISKHQYLVLLLKDIIGRELK